MPEFLRDLRVGPLSFWLGFAAGILLLWIASKLLPLVQQARQAWRQRRQVARMGAASTLEARYRFDTLQYAQKLHLAAVLFSLDEIQIEPGS